MGIYATLTVHTQFLIVKDKNGIPKDKYLRVTDGSELYKKLLNGGTELPMCWIVEE